MLCIPNHAPLLQFLFVLVSLLINKKLEGVLLFTLCDKSLLRISFQVVGCHTSEHDIAVLWSLFQLVFERVEPSVG